MRCSARLKWVRNYPPHPLRFDDFFQRHSVLPLARAQRQRFDRISRPSDRQSSFNLQRVKTYNFFHRKNCVKKVHRRFKMLSLQNNSTTTSLMHPWFARPISGPGFESRPHREHHEFLAVSDESAASTTSTEEQISFYNSYHKSSSHKKISENRPRSAQYTYGDFLDLPSGMPKAILYVLGRVRV